MPMPTFVASGGFVSGAAALSPAFPASDVQANDIALLVIEQCNEGTRSAPAGGWAEVTNSPQAVSSGAVAGSVRLNVYWLRCAGNEDGTTVSVADSGDHQTAEIFIFRGCKTSGNPWNGTPQGSTQAATTSYSATGYTTSAANCMAVICTATDKDLNDTAILTAGPTNENLTNLTVRRQQSVNTGQGGGLIVITGEKASAGALGNTTGTVDASEEMAHLVIALEGQAAQTFNQTCSIGCATSETVSK